MFVVGALVTGPLAVVLVPLAGPPLIYILRINIIIFEKLQSFNFEHIINFRLIIDN